MSTLETERLRLRAFQESDLDDYAFFCADPEVMRYLGDGRTFNRTESWRHLAGMLGHWQLRGFGMWAVEEKSSSRLVGRVGFLQPDGWPGFELGWVLGRPFWGNGYATEAARRALRYAFEDLDRDTVISLIYPDNIASIRVAERLGEHLQETIELRDREVLVYGIDRKGFCP